MCRFTLRKGRSVPPILHPRRARHAPARRAVTLLELAVVVLIVGLLGAMAATRYGGTAVAQADAHGFARRLALDCLQARRRAISTGESHALKFTFSGNSPNVKQYALYRDPDGSNVLVDEQRIVPEDVRVRTGGAATAEFAFTGEAAASYSMTVDGPHRSYAITVPQASGKAFIDEL